MKDLIWTKVKMASFMGVASYSVILDRNLIHTSKYVHSSFHQW
jgi:hypothetical protein